MHDCALEQKRERSLSSAPRVEHTGHCSEKSTKTTLQNHIKINIAPNIFKRSFNNPRCSEKCLWGEYILKASYNNKKFKCHGPFLPPLPIPPPAPSSETAPSHIPPTNPSNCSSKFALLFPKTKWYGTAGLSVDWLILGVDAKKNCRLPWAKLWLTQFDEVYESKFSKKRYDRHDLMKQMRVYLQKILWFCFIRWKGS